MIRFSEGSMGSQGIGQDCLSLQFVVEQGFQLSKGILFNGYFYIDYHKSSSDLKTKD